MARKTTGTPYLRGNIWWCKYYVNGVPTYKSLKTGDKEKAQARMALEVAPVAAGKAADKAKALALRAGDAETKLAHAIDAARVRILLADAWREYLGASHRPQSGEETLKDFGQRWNKFSDWMTEQHADIKNLEAVTEKHASAFARTLKSLSPNRYNKIIQTCRLVFKVLGPQLKNSGNPFERIGCRALTTRSHRELSEAELRDVCGAATGELRVLFAIGLYTALRMGDAATLRWEEVSFPLNRITRKPMKTARKNKIVAIPLHPTLRAILEETPKTERRDFVLPGLAMLYARDKSALSKRIQKHFKECKIKTQLKHADKTRATCEVGFHSLRHSFVTICAAAGVPLAVVQALCGHGSPAIQAKYIHVGVEAAAQAIDALPSLASLAAPPPQVQAPQLPAASAEAVSAEPAATTVETLTVTLAVPKDSPRAALLQAVVGGMTDKEAEMLLAFLESAIRNPQPEPEKAGTASGLDPALVETVTDDKAPTGQGRAGEGDTL